MSGWSKKEDTGSIVFEFLQSPYTLPKLSLSVYSGLNFSVAAYNWFLSDDHYIYSDYKRSLKHTSISTLMATLQSAQICEGLSKEEHVVFLCENPSPCCGTSCVMGKRKRIQSREQHSLSKEMHLCLAQVRRG